MQELFQINNSIYKALLSCCRENNVTCGEWALTKYCLVVKVVYFEQQIEVTLATKHVVVLSLESSNNIIDEKLLEDIKTSGIDTSTKNSKMLFCDSEGILKDILIECFYLAASDGTSIIIEALLNIGVDKLCQCSTALVDAAKINSTNCFQLLLKPSLEERNTKNPNTFTKVEGDLNDAFNAASKNGNLSIMNMLIDANINPRNNQDRALIFATQNNQLEAVQLLLDLGADATVDNSWPLLNAIDNQNPDMVKLLLEHGADVYAMKYIAIKRAFGTENLEILTFLLHKAFLKAEGKDVAKDNTADDTDYDTMAIANFFIRTNNLSGLISIIDEQRKAIASV